MKLVDIDTTGMTGANHLYIRALPYALSSGVPANGMCYTQDVTLSGEPIFQIDNSTFGRIYQNASATTTDVLLVSDLTSGSADITINFTYQTDS